METHWRLAGGGAYSASGSSTWLNTIRTRGRGGVDNATQYSTWGGMIGFTTNVNWNFSSSPPAANQYDFQTVATHELMHIFGFGLGNPSYTRLTGSGFFAGSNVTAALGYSPRMSADTSGDSPDHFADANTPGGVNSIMNASIAMGVRKDFSAVEAGALRDIGWGVTVAASPVQSSTVAAGPVAVGSSAATAAQTSIPVFAIGTGAGTSGNVLVYNSSGNTVGSIPVFTPAFTGGARVATGDVTGDGVADYIVGAGEGGAPVVSVYDGRSGSLLRSFYAYDPAFTGGVYVAVGHVLGNSYMDIVTGTGEGGGPYVQVFDGATGNHVIGFWGIPAPWFRGGVRVAVGDLNNDGYADIVSAAGTGGGPYISTWSGRALASGSVTNLFADFFAFEPSLRIGAYVAVGDFNGDGIREIMVAAGKGGGPRVSAFSTNDLFAGRVVRTIDFFTGNPFSATGVRIAAQDLNNDGIDDIITGSGPGSDGIIRVFHGRSLGSIPYSRSRATSGLPTGPTSVKVLQQLT